MPGCLNTLVNQLGTKRTEGRDQETKKRVSIQFGVQKYRRQKILGERTNISVTQQEELC